ncbi:MAG: MazG-like family protein [Candidatus Roizmanbacteria bacterium]|nr:MazG-like family protein [Candidatus Roizmanbacteria bacterium]
MSTLSEHQQKVKEIVRIFNFNWPLYVQYIHLVEEVAELGEALTVYNGDRKSGSGETALADHNDVEEEIGDVLFTILELCNLINLDASELLEKTYNRYENKNKKLKTSH